MPARSRTLCLFFRGLLLARLESQARSPQPALLLELRPVLCWPWPELWLAQAPLAWVGKSQEPGDLLVTEWQWAERAQSSFCPWVVPMLLRASLAPENQGFCRSPPPASLSPCPRGQHPPFSESLVNGSPCWSGTQTAPLPLWEPEAGVGGPVTCPHVWSLPCSPVRLSGLGTSFSRSLEAGPFHRHSASLSKSPGLILCNEITNRGRAGVKSYGRVELTAVGGQRWTARPRGCPLSQTGGSGGHAFPGGALEAQ